MPDQAVRPDPPVSPPVAAFDTSTLDALLGSLGDRGAALRDDLLTSYVSEGDVRVAEMVAGSRTGDRDAVRRVAHTLRSSSAVLGLADLADLLERLEVAAAPDRADPLDEMVARSAALYRRAADGIAVVLAASRPA